MNNNCGNINVHNKPHTTANHEQFRITTGGSDCLKFIMGDYVNTNSPLFIEEPPSVVERYFAGGQIRPPQSPDILQPVPNYLEDSLDELRQSELYFSSHISELFSRGLEGKYVAIIDNTVVDSDVNLDVMMQRVYKVYGYRPILMRRVTKQYEHTAKLPSPKIARNR